MPVHMAHLNKKTILNLQILLQTFDKLHNPQLLGYVCGHITTDNLVAGIKITDKSRCSIFPTDVRYLLRH
jgi:hypothetical protein